MIEFLREIKNKNYKASGQLEEDFYRLQGELFQSKNSNGDFYKEDLGRLYRTEKFLLEEIVRIHKREESLINKSYLGREKNLGQVLPHLRDGRRAYNIYSFKEPGYDYYLVGDLHSDCLSLRTLLKKIDFFGQIERQNKFRLIFIGDYVDRGQRHLELVHMILTLKYLFSDQVYLQRGNHDMGSYKDSKLKMAVGTRPDDPEEKWFLKYLLDLAEKNSSYPKEAIKDYLNFFDSLALIGLIEQQDKVYFLVHGGIPRYSYDSEGYYDYLDSLKDLTDPSIKDKIGRSMVHNIVWSDPTEDPEEDLRENNGRFKFRQEHFESFRQLIGFDYLIRGHQVKEAGCESIFKGRLTTVFSSGQIASAGLNINKDTAYNQVKSPCLLHLSSQGQLRPVTIDLT